MNIHEEVDHILAGIEMIRQRPRRDTLTKRIQAWVAAINLEWHNIKVLEQSMPDGTVLYTASMWCSEHHEIHTYLLWPDGESFEMASPSPVQDNREDGDGVC